MKLFYPATALANTIDRIASILRALLWLIDPEDRSVIIIGMGQTFDAIDEPQAILPVPELAKSIQLTISDIFGWLQQPQRKTAI